MRERQELPYTASCVPSLATILCTGMYLIRSLNPVWNHSSPKHISLQCETLRTSTSLSNDWMTTPAASFVPCLAYNSGAPLVSKFGCDISVGTPVRTDAGGGRGEPQRIPTGKGECHLFLAGNHAVLWGNQCSKTIVRQS